MRLIDADALKTDLTRFYDGEVTARQLIDKQPTIEAEPVRHGRWKQIKVGGENYPFWNNYCSVCRWTTYIAGAGNFLYCPNCGAKMDGGEDV